jgi:hypothetical protein
VEKINQFQKEKNNQSNSPQLKSTRGKGFNNFIFHSLQGCFMRKENHLNQKKIRNRKKPIPYDVHYQHSLNLLK